MTNFDINPAYYDVITVNCNSDVSFVWVSFETSLIAQNLVAEYNKKLPKVDAEEIKKMMGGFFFFATSPYPYWRYFDTNNQLMKAPLGSLKLLDEYLTLVRDY